MAKKFIHVLKSIQGWKAEYENSPNSFFRSPVKNEVIAKAFEKAKKERECQVIIHKIDGTIQEEKSFGQPLVKVKKTAISPEN